MIGLAEAQTLLLSEVSPLDSETVAIGECGGRILARDIAAARDQPPAPMSAMDGYAISATDIHAGAELKLIGEAPAGAPFDGAVAPGSAVRIATGAVVPPGAGHVVMQEIVERRGERIAILEPPGPATFIRLAGCDFTAGQVLARSGEPLTPARTALAAAANLAEVQVRRRPRVAIFPSGDELREPGSGLEPHLIVNSAAYALAGLVTAWGGIAVRQRILPDHARRCERQIEEAASEADVIVPLGGASVGDRDVLRHVFQKLGARMLFERIAVQPGKPCWHARLPDGRLVLGLPGNPASAFVCAHLLLRPLLAALTGQDPSARLMRAALAGPMPQGGNRETYWRAKLIVEDDGTLRVASDSRQDSSLLTPLAAANALIRRMAFVPPASIGEIVDVLPIGPIA